MEQNGQLTIGKVEFEKQDRKSILLVNELQREQLITIILEDIREHGVIYQALMLEMQRAINKKELKIKND